MKFRLTHVLIVAFSLCGVGTGLVCSAPGLSINKYAKGQEAHVEAVSVISGSMSDETGLPEAHFEKYASDLANTLGHLEPEVLQRVMGSHFNKLP